MTGPTNRNPRRLRSAEIALASGVSAGISDIEIGLRTRYEIRRKFAPYVELTWVREKGARVALPESVDTEGFRIGLGLRLIY